MENQEEKRTAFIQFYMEIDQIIGYLPAESENEIHDIYLKYLELHKQEIESAKKEGWKKGYQDSIKMNNKQITKLYRAIVIIFSVFSALILGKLIYSFMIYLNK